MDVPDEGLKLRIARIEWRADDLHESIEKQGARIGDLEHDAEQALVQATTTSRDVIIVQRDVGELKATLNKLTWAIVTLTFTVAGGAIGIAIEIAARGVGVK
jgi:prefoldin subunit 5